MPSSWRLSKTTNVEAEIFLFSFSCLLKGTITMSISLNKLVGHQTRVGPILVIHLIFGQPIPFKMWLQQ